MLAFWIFAALLLVLALALVLPALLQPNTMGTATNNATQANLSVLRSQLAQLDADAAAGYINAEQLALAKSDIERRVLEEESAPQTTAASTHPAKSTRTAWALGLAIPVLALGTYGLLGNLQALDPANRLAQAASEPTPEQFEAMISAFAARLEAMPATEAPDPKAWEMLARSYAAMQKLPEANKAYKRAIALNPGNAQLLADHADVLAMLQGQSMVGEPTTLFQRALILDPNNLKALALAGSAAIEQKDFAKAIQFWEKAAKLTPPGSDFAKNLASSVEEARAALAAPKTSGKSAPTLAVVQAKIQGTVSLAPALASKVAPDDTVFIFARAAAGPRMPLAILKHKASELPITFTLDDSTAMTDELKLSKFEQVIVGVRVSKSGNALAQSGDLIGQSAPIKADGRTLRLMIDRVQP